MKKQIKKLTLNKKTISNLSTSEMQGQIGGGYTNTGGNCGCSGNCTFYPCTYGCTITCHGLTCNRNKNCDSH